MKKLYHFLNKVNFAFWSRVVRSTELSVESLSIFRIICGLFLLCLQSPSFVWIGKVPQAFFKPPVLSAANLANGFPGSPFFLVINIVLVFFALFITLGVKARFSTFSYAVLFVIASNFQFSFGKIDHSTILYVVLLFCMGFSNWGHRLAILPDKQINVDFNQKSLSLLAVVICFAFFTAGFAKAVRWINFDLSSNGMGAWYFNKLYLRNHLLAPYVGKYLPFAGFKVMDYLGVIFELSPVFFLLRSKRAWCIWLVLACFFHACNAVLLNISFLSFSIVYLAFVDFSFLFHQLEKMFASMAVKMASFFLLAAVLTVRIYYITNDIESANIFFKPDLVVCNLYFSLVVWLLLIILLYRTAFRKADAHRDLSFK